MARARRLHRPRRPLGRLRRAGQGLGQRAALDQLEHQERRPGVLADAVDLDDVRVPQPRHGLDLDPEPRRGLRAGQRAGDEHLHGHRALQLGLPGAIDDPHAAPAQDAQDLVAGDAGIRRGAVRRAESLSTASVARVPARVAVGARSSSISRWSSIWSFSSSACSGKRRRNSSSGGCSPCSSRSRYSAKIRSMADAAWSRTAGKGVEVVLGGHPLAQPAALGLVDPQGHDDLLGIADAGLFEEVLDAGLLPLPPEAPQPPARDRRRRGRRGRRAGASAFAVASFHS